MKERWGIKQRSKSGEKEANEGAQEKHCCFSRSKRTHKDAFQSFSPGLQDVDANPKIHMADTEK